MIINQKEVITIQQLGAESLPDSIYFYSKNFITWTKYNKELNKHTTEYKKINIPSILNLPFLRCLRMFYAKRQLVGNAPIYFQLGILLIQFLLSFNHPGYSFFLPYLIAYLIIGLLNLILIVDPNNPANDQMRNHAAEHLVAEKMLFNKDSIYSFGCSNSHLVVCLLVNLIIVNFMPIIPAYLLSMFISGEIVMWLVFHQDSILAKLLKPLLFGFQQFTLLEPREQHIKTATLAINKLRELENEN